MKLTAPISKIVVVLAVLACLASPGSAQKAPRQEKLLNGLKVLMWPDQTASGVTVRIRVHSGSAFDPQGKEGVMYLLARNVFPTEAAREFFREDLGGNVEVVSNYDYIQINAESNPASLIAMLDTLAQVVSNPTIDKETTDSLKAELLSELELREKDPAYVADQAAAKRLFGKFPYGRPEMGTKESVSKIDFAELIFAKSRFFGADNASVTVRGKFDPDLAYRAIRRYFGAWLKSDKRVPPTFEQPADPPAEMLTISTELTGQRQVRVAIRGYAKGSKDLAAADVLAHVLNDRLKATLSPREVTRSFVRHEGHVLPGFFLFGYESGPAQIGSARAEPDAAAGPEVIARLFAKPITELEFTEGRSAAMSALDSRGFDESWLDADTYGISPAGGERKSLESLTLADVQRVAGEISKRPAAKVMVDARPAAQTNSN